MTEQTQQPNTQTEPPAHPQQQPHLQVVSQPMPGVKVKMPVESIGQHFDALFAIAKGFHNNLLSAQQFWARLLEARNWAQAALTDMQQVKMQQDQMAKIKAQMELETAQSKAKADAEVAAAEKEDAIRMAAEEEGIRMAEDAAALKK